MKGSLVLIPATRFSQRLSGLHRLGKPPENTGLWIAPCRAIHTLGLGYCIDVLYLDVGRNIIKRVDAMLPWRVSACVRAWSVVELPAGFCERNPDYVQQVHLALQRLHA